MRRSRVACSTDPGSQAPHWEFQVYISKSTPAALGDKRCYQRIKAPLLPLCHFLGTSPIPKPATWWAGSYYISQLLPRARDSQALDSLLPGAQAEKQGWVAVCGSGGLAGDCLWRPSNCRPRANPRTAPRAPSSSSLKRKSPSKWTLKLLPPRSHHQ